MLGIKCKLRLWNLEKKNLFKRHIERDTLIIRKVDNLCNLKKKKKKD